MDVLRTLIIMLMSIHKYNVFDVQRPEEIPSFDIVLFLLPSILTRSSDDAIKTIYDLIYTLASHVRPLCSSHSQNVRPQDLKTMLLPFRLGTFATEEDEAKEGLFQSADYLATLLRIAQAPRAPVWRRGRAR